MDFDQLAIGAILLAMLGAYALERFRVEVVAMCGLAAAWLAGVVPATQIFAGFANPAVITVVEVLLFVSALARTRAVDDLARRITLWTRRESAVLAILCAIGGGVSVFMNNIGALALVFPVALSVSARLGIPAGRLLMPLSFATLLGGLCSLTGTPANLVVNQWKVIATGSGFAYFEPALVGGPVALAGIALIVLAAPRVFARFHGGAAPDGAEIGPDAFLAEMGVPAGSPLAGLALPAAEERCQARIHGVVRGGAHVFARRAGIALAPGDTLLVEAAAARLEWLDDEGLLAAPDTAAGAERVEVVVMPDSLLQGSRIGDVEAFARRAVAVGGLASRRRRIEGSFADLQIGMGDVLMLAGTRAALREVAADCGLLVLSPQRPPRPARRAAPAILAFAGGVLASAFNLLPPELAFAGVVLALALMGNLDMRTALQDLNWPIVILLACMIPLGMAVAETGAARALASGMAGLLPPGEPLAVVAALLLLATALTQFIDNVSAAAVLGPVAAGLAERTGVPVDTALLAVMIGVSLDFLTPFGHHNNAVVMGAAGYRFADFPKLGAPLLGLSLLVAIACFAVVLANPGWQ